MPIQPPLNGLCPVSRDIKGISMQVTEWMNERMQVSEDVKEKSHFSCLSLYLLAALNPIGH